MPVDKFSRWGLVAVCIALSLATPGAGQLPSSQATTIDLMTSAGAALVNGQWRYSDVEIIPISSAATDQFLTKLLAANPNGNPPAFFPNKPPAGEQKTYDIRPRAGGPDFDDSSWPVIPAESLTDFRGGGQLCFGWYRISITMPERVGNFPTTGTRAFITVNADDYGEVWIQGRLPRSVGKPNPQAISGMNSTTRVPLSESVKPGERIQLAIFAINGPLSDAPPNRLWVREAKIEFVR